MIGDPRRPVTTTMARSVVDLCKIVRERDEKIAALTSFVEQVIDRDPKLAKEILGGE